MGALDAIIATKPAIVIPAHAAANTVNTLASVTYTRNYLLAFEQALKASKTSGELVKAIQAKYPKATNTDNLVLSAKVATGEMKW